MTWHEHAVYCAGAAPLLSDSCTHLQNPKIVGFFSGLRVTEHRHVRQLGVASAQVLAEELPALLAGIKFKGSMRWRGDAVFSRPLRWLLALHGRAVPALQYAGLTAGDTTRVLRNADQPVLQARTLGLQAPGCRAGAFLTPL